MNELKSRKILMEAAEKVDAEGGILHPGTLDIVKTTALVEISESLRSLAASGERLSLPLRTVGGAVHGEPGD